MENKTRWEPTMKICEDQQIPIVSLHFVIRQQYSSVKSMFYETYDNQSD